MKSTKLRKLKRKFSAIIAAVLAIALLLSGTFAWVSTTQKEKNEVRGTVDYDVILHDDFDEDADFNEGGEKSVYVENYGEGSLYIRVRLDEYMEIGKYAGLTEEEARAEALAAGDLTQVEIDAIIAEGGSVKQAASLVASANFENEESWTPHVPSDEYTTDICQEPFHDYWHWLMGGEKNYMPQEFQPGTNFLPDGAVQDATQYDGTEENVEKTLKATKVITMAKWIAEGMNPGPFWVIDADGWAYWAQALKGGDATGLLLSQITIQPVPEVDYYYAINVLMQAASKGDWGFDINDSQNTAPTAAALALLEKIAGAVHQDSGSMDEDFINTSVDPYESNATLSLKFDEGSGSTVSDADRSISGTIATNQNASAYRPNPEVPFWTQRSAASGHALSFDGLYNSVSYPSNQVSIEGDELTIDVFVAPRNYVWSNTIDDMENWITHIICGQYANDAGFKLGMTKYGYWTFQVYVEGQGWQKLYCDSSAKLDTYDWNHLTCVFDGQQGTMKIYKNGELAGELTLNPGSIKKANVDFIVGKGNIRDGSYVSEYDTSHFNGLMDELKIYNIAKSDSEVANYHNGFTAGDSMKTVIYDDARLQETYTADDYYRPQLHAAPPMHWMNEPHALFNYNGKWHMFYQANSYGPFWQGGITWGHWVSDDMIDWEYVKDAVVPIEGSLAHDGVWSGNMAFNEDGIPILFITAGNDTRKDGDEYLLSNQNIAIVSPKDPTDPYLTEWELASGLSIAQKDLSTADRGTMNEFRDPQIFEEDGIYYMVICGRSADGLPVIHLYTTDNGKFYTEANGVKDYKVWTYRGNIMPQTFYDNYESKFGKSGELPNLAPLYSADGQTKKYILSFAPAPNDSGIDISSYYWIGEFDKTTYKFAPDEQGLPKVMDTCYKGFTGGTIYYDAASKKTYTVGIMQDDKNTAELKNSGWAHVASMVRELYLREDGTLGTKSAADFSTYVDSSLPGITLNNANVAQVNAAIGSIDQDMLKISFKIKANGATNFGFRLKKEAANDFVTLEYKDGTIGIVKSGYTPNVAVGAPNKVNTNSPFSLIDNTLSGEIYIDHALIEAFFDEKAVISSMVYNKGNAMEVFGDGIEFEYFNIEYLKK